VASSYVSLASNLIYSVASVPLALHFITKQEFGLWALMFQITSYLVVIDFGMSPAVSRLLIEEKDRPDSGAYGSLIQTAVLVNLVQGLLILAAGLLLAPSFANLLRIPTELRPQFDILVRYQCAIAGATFAVRVFRNILYAHQRNDIINHMQAVVFLAQLGVFYAALKAQSGVYSILWMNAFALVFSVSANCWNCLRLRLLPPRHAWGRPVWSRFKELFMYSKDVFVVHLGSILIMTSQSVIVSRTMGLVAVAAWAVGTKAFAFLSQLIYQFYDYSEPAFSEMIVRGEKERLRARFSGILVVSEVIGTIAAVIYASCNSTFVTVWTAGKISWSGWNDVLLDCWLIVTVVVHADSCFTVLTKRIGFMRYVYLLEGLVFVIVASLAAPRGGFPAIIGTSILCSACFTGPYGIKRINAYFGFHFPELELRWLATAVRVAGIMILTALVLWYIGQRFSPIPRLVLNAVALGPLGLVLFLRYGTTREMRVEVLGHVPRFFQPVLAPLLGADK
jgi:O-antigen/teichoic acid export membrane protein